MASLAELFEDQDSNPPPRQRRGARVKTAA
jgi:hypothetical protein